jgi:small subunit ribosomal protein S1
MQDERAIVGRETLANLTTGAIVDGTIRTIQPYGAFVDLGGIEGLIHVSELGHGRVDKVGDVVSVGEQVQVKILAVDKAADGSTRISLSLRQATQAPDRPASASGPDKKENEAYGVYVETATGAGVVPTRELDLPPGGDPRRAYPVGKLVRVVAIGADEKGRTRFSMKRVEETEARSNYQQFRAAQNAPKTDSLGSFGELLKRKL